MAHPDPAVDGRDGVYDVHLCRRPADSLWARYPAVAVHTTGAQTALRRRVSEPAQLDALLQRLRSVGLVLMDVRRVSSVATPTPSAPDSVGRGEVYEVRVNGELGKPLLRYLNWPHYVVPGQTMVRIDAASADLLRFLEACTDAGASIERVRRVEPAWAREPLPA
jgi:hypothetical protein